MEPKDKILKEDNPELLDRVHLESEIVTMVKMYVLVDKSQFNGSGIKFKCDKTSECS